MRPPSASGSFIDNYDLTLIVQLLLLHIKISIGIILKYFFLLKQVKEDISTNIVINLKYNIF